MSDMSESLAKSVFRKGLIGWSERNLLASEQQNPVRVMESSFPIVRHHDNGNRPRRSDSVEQLVEVGFPPDVDAGRRLVE